MRTVIGHNDVPFLLSSGSSTLLPDPELLLAAYRKTLPVGVISLHTLCQQILTMMVS